MMVFAHDYGNYPELTNAEIEVLGLTSPHKQITEDFEAVVVKVHDGDTVTLRTSFRDFDFPLRLLDIDAPEMSEGGSEARDWLKSRILGKTVSVMINQKNRVGKYGRLLGRIISGGLDVGQEQIMLGLVSGFGRKKEGEPEPLDKVFSLRQWL